MKGNIENFWSSAIKDLNKKENRNGQLIVSPHWYSLICIIFLVTTVVVAFLLRHDVPVIYFVGFFPVYILAIIFSFENKSVYVKNDENFLDHKISRKHLSNFYQSLDKSEKQSFLELVLRKKEITYRDLERIKKS